AGFLLTGIIFRSFGAYGVWSHDFLLIFRFAIAHKITAETLNAPITFKISRIQRLFLFHV
ncbi:MAG: hypothetical protein ACI9DJ_000941, partial [Algoriphagus sp.]